MIIQALTYFMEVLTFMLAKIELFEIAEGVTVASIIIWYLCIMVVLWVIGTLVTKSAIGSKGSKKS